MSLCCRQTGRITARQSPRISTGLVTRFFSAFQPQNKGSSDQVIFSGIQPTGIPHLGNYLGALKPWVDLQNSAPPGTKFFYSVVDLHAITLPQAPENLRKWKREALATLLAIGLDPERSTIFFQSSVSGHSELMWILSCTASVGYLSRMTQWKSKLSVSSNTSIFEKEAQQLRLGLFSYPVLQAADILVHRATHVPVGEDQSQHLEFSRECVTKFNQAVGKEILVPPITILSPAKRIMSLKNPESKMSKSHKAEGSRIMLNDTPEVIRKKIQVAVTDSINGVSFDPENRPGVSNLLRLLSHCGGEAYTPEELAARHSQLSLKDLKSLVSDAVTESLSDIRVRYERILNEDDGKYLDYVQERGAKSARESAEETMALVHEAVGF